MNKDNNTLKSKLIDITKKSVLLRKCARKFIYIKKWIVFKKRTLRN